MSEQEPLTREVLQASLLDAGFDPVVAARLASQARPALALATEPVEAETPPLGASRMGGCPDLPEGVPWPVRPPYAAASRWQAQHDESIARYRSEMAEGRKVWYTPDQGAAFIRDHEAERDALGRPFPLSFVLQLDFGALASEPGLDPAFPRQGRLLFFVDRFCTPPTFEAAASAGWALIWDEGPAAALGRAAVPEALAAAAADCHARLVLPACRLVARSCLTPIDGMAVEWDAFPLEDHDALARYGECLEGLGCSAEPGEGCHRLGGWPLALQGSMQKQAQLAANGIDCGYSDVYRTERARALLPGARDWRLLLQVDSDPNVDPNGVGCLYVLIRNDDLAARRFERAWVIAQNT